VYYASFLHRKQLRHKNAKIHLEKNFSASMH